MMMLGNDSEQCILQLHQVILQNLSIYIWADFVILVLTCVMVNFVIMGIGLIYKCNVLYHIKTYEKHDGVNAMYA